MPIKLRDLRITEPPNTQRRMARESKLIRKRKYKVNFLLISFDQYLNLNYCDGRCRS